MMRIALVGHIRHPIAPPFAGGMEAHTWHLAERLAARGHDVTLFASGDSADGAPRGVTVHPVVGSHYDHTHPWHRYHDTPELNAHQDLAFAGAARDLLSGGFDVIHNNSLHRYPPRLGAAMRMPTVTSLHVPPFDALRRAVHESATPWTRFTVTSRVQARRWWPATPPAQASVVWNGIDPDAWPFVPQGDGTAVWSGRITPNKGTHLAVRAAAIAGVPLTLFGTIEHRDYFQDEVKPHLTADIRYGGHLRGADLAREIGRASAMLFTPLWDEPFGLVAIEAMATGLPVASIENGAVREVIGSCGTYAPAHDAPALARALRAAMDLPRRACRARVMDRFTLDRMTDRLEQSYREAVAARWDAFAPPSFPRIELDVAVPDRRVA
ncbi:glycosyltransferase [Jannaschia sp. LMIT008]|uniref:glycosyltransferase n=1 Tax=Jannaschia maritima TaxID=3032585 RepID=UPI0028116D9B|nr:glycosyltransferase [Jannaschia sp. LMIT008]